MKDADFDIVISGGHVIDPANGVDAARDVAIVDGRIAAVAEQLPPHTVRRVIDAAGQYVTPGLVDFHAHLYWGRDYLGIDADSLAWRCGVTTWVDAGSAGAFSIPGLREHIVRRSALRMFAFINISYLGIPGMNYDEYCNPKACDVPLLARVVEANRDLIVGVKVRMGKEGVCYPGLRPLQKAVEAAEATGLPIMCHISDTPPPVDRVLALLRPGDIVTHAFTGAGERLVDGRGRVRPAAVRAKAAGV
ncbi:MAG TPA: amidohydrolase/deacetylase family metallohydrolase, partial [Thermomicrobiales bacterium]|nr:amidohydrolase/deacetylase family metallohydrolase [Thermomicrobiales bacterium]